MLAAKAAKRPSSMYKRSKYVRKIQSLKPGATPVAIYKKAKKEGEVPSSRPFH